MLYDLNIVNRSASGAKASQQKLAEVGSEIRPQPLLERFGAVSVEVNGVESISFSRFSGGAGVWPSEGQSASSNARSIDSVMATAHGAASQKPVTSKACSTIQLATARELQASFNMAGGLIHLEPGDMRQLHWHPNADEWQYLLRGEMELSVFASEGKASMSRLVSGDVGYVPKGYGHALLNSSSKPVDILVVFNEGDYQSIDLDDWIASNPDSVLGNTFQLPAGIVEKLPRSGSVFSSPRLERGLLILVV